MKRYSIFFLFFLFIFKAYSQGHENKILTSLNELYSDCNNFIDIHVSHLSDDNEYTFDVEGGEVLKGNKKNQIGISPVSSEVTIKVYQGEKYLGHKTLPVTETPRPVVLMYTDNKEVDIYGRSGREMNQLSLKVGYGEGMKKCLSGEFRIKSWSAVVLKENKAIGAKLNAEGETMDVTEWKKVLKKGDRILIDVKKVVKVTPSGEEEVHMGPMLLSIFLE